MGMSVTVSRTEGLLERVLRPIQLQCSTGFLGCSLGRGLQPHGPGVSSHAVIFLVEVFACTCFGFYYAHSFPHSMLTEEEHTPGTQSPGQIAEPGV